MNRPRPLTRFAGIVAGDEQLASWNARRIREEALLRAVRRVLPRPVGERTSIASAQTAVLELTTTAGAIATVLRQHGPAILAALHRDGWQFSAIKVRVQPQSMPMSSPKSQSRQWDSGATRSLRALQAGLEDGPLKAALARLLKSR